MNEEPWFNFAHDEAVEPPRHAIEIAFAEFHDANPHVWLKLLEICRFVRREKGIQRWGIAACFERLRWVSQFQTEGDCYKLNNNFKAYYARRLNAEPGLRGLFEVRTSDADDALVDAPEKDDV
jgi:hypothetical protein